MKSNEQHVDALESNEINKIISSNVFDSFRALSNSEKVKRVNAAVNLIHYFNLKYNDGNNNEPDKETKYTLQRLIRGVGAATADSRSSYFTALVAFLSIPQFQHGFPSISQIFTIMDKELHVGKGGCKDKEDSDAIVGQTLVCGAVLHSNKIQEANGDELQKIVQILLKASHQKPFHSSLAYTFLIELLEKVPSTEYINHIWPLVQKELKRPWEKHTMNTVYLLLETQSKYPKLVDDEFLLSSITTNEILQPLSYKHLSRLFWSPSSLTIAISHPAYDTFGKFLATSVSSKQLLKFWQNEINQILIAPSKSKEIVTLKLLTIAFNTRTISHNVAIQLLSDSFIKLITKTLKNSKQQKMELIVPFYDEFFEAVENYLEGLTPLPNGDEAKVAIIKRFVAYPGILLIEKYTSNRIVHKFIAKLGANGIATLYDFYKSVLLGQAVKDPKDKSEDWLFVEKQHSIQMMQALLAQKIGHTEIAWRTEQLKQLLKLSLFNTGPGADAVVVKDEDAKILSKDLQTQIKQVFYANLQFKLNHLESEIKILLPLVEHCNEFVSKKTANKFLRQPLSDKALVAWRKMYERITSIIQNGKKQRSNLNNVFVVLLLHMGLQLFRESEMAELAIDDLEKCMERADKKLAKSKGNSNVDEPEWIEVVVDLFLHLLSQNTSFLRNVVNSVFPQLCGSLNLTAVHQILSVLDLKEKNPLSANDEANESDEQDDSSDDNEEASDEDNEDNESDNDVDDGDSEGDNDNEEDEDISTEEDEGTISEQLRSIVSNALGLGHDTDNDSVDLNDMDDAEAERLDNALSEAFQSMRKKPSSNSKKKTKKERTTNTTVMHFRIRVLDLIEIYLEKNPDLAITLEILISLLEMLDHCNANKDLTPLIHTIERVLKKLFAIRQFSSVDDVTEDALADILSKLVDRRVTPAALDEHNKLISKCCTFLITASDLLAIDGQTHQFYQLIAEYLEKFLKTRNPMFAFSSFRDIMKIRWQGVWKLSLVLVEKGLLAKNDARVFRRSQAIELLNIIYKNHGFIAHDIDQFNKINKKNEGCLQEYVTWLQTNSSVSPKELHALLELLRDLHKCSKTIKNYKSNINWETVCDGIQNIRKHTPVLKYQSYAAFCNLFNIPIIKNIENDANKMNGIETKGSWQNEDDDEVAAPKQNGSTSKRKAEPSDGKKQRKSKKMKRLKKEERLKIVSAGFDSTLSFSLANGIDDDDVDSDS